MSSHSSHGVSILRVLGLIYEQPVLSLACNHLKME